MAGETQEVFIKGEEIGHPVYFVTNENVGITMKIEPTPALQDNTIVRRKDVAEITFVNNRNSEGKLKRVWVEWPYLITTEDIDIIDVSDSDYIEEVFGKYGRKFLEVGGFTATDQFEQYKELVGRVFPDIEEKRRVEKREG